MSLSFKESLKNNSKKNTSVVELFAGHTIDMPAVATPAVADNSVMTLDEHYSIAAYSGNDGNWQEHADYVRYNYFSDDNISVINDEKDIVLNKKQFNITQEENSQYMPFEMPRYYDGFDLVNTALSIHYHTSSGKHGSSKPINVTFNDEKIRFGWLVDAEATIDVGALGFEIHAYGVIAGNDGAIKGYVWKSKPNSDLKVLESLCNCEGVVNEIDDSWVQELVTQVAESVADQIANAQIGSQVIAAENAAASAKQYAEEAREYADNASSAATEAVNIILDNYATTDYVDTAVAGVDVTEQLANYVQTSDLEANYYNKTDAAQLMNSTIESKGYATTGYVDSAIAGADISDKLNDYYKKDETYNKTEIDTALDNVSVDLTGYATETYVNDKVTPVSSSVATNTENISSLSRTVGALQDSVNSIDTSPRLTYDVEYNDVENPDVGENVFVFYEITNEGQENESKEAKKKFTIVGGGGGGATSSS